MMQNLHPDSVGEGMLDRIYLISKTKFVRVGKVVRNKTCMVPEGEEIEEADEVLLSSERTYRPWWRL